MRSRWNVLVVLVYMAVAGTVLSYMGIKMAGPCIPYATHCLQLQAQFANAAGLLHNNDVRIAGVSAGQVSAIDVDGKLAVVHFTVEDRFLPIYKDAHALVRPKNLLGETYIEITRGTPSAGAFQDGEVIPVANTITPVQVDEVLNALDPDTRTKLQIVINSLGEATAQRGDDMNISVADLKRISADLALTSTSLNQERDNLDALLVQLDLIQKTTADYHQQLADVLRNWDDVSATQARHSAALADSLSHLNGVLTDLDTALTPNAPALQAAVSKLPTTIDHANDFLGISTQMTDAFITPPKPGTGAPIQDAVSLFPRLAQTMVGTNRCDTHIYANGYQNIPGVTEDAACPASNGSLQGEVFSGKPAPGQVTQNRHLWRVMGMVAPNEIPCGLSSPSGPPATCSPGTIGTEPYSGTAAATPVQNQAPAPAAPSGPFAFFAQLWHELVGGGDA